jgi:hypothetical protein
VSDEYEEKVFDDSSPEVQVLNMLKGHAIDILVRMNPSRKNYYKLVWEEYNF